MGHYPSLAIDADHFPALIHKSIFTKALAQAPKSKMAIKIDSKEILKLFKFLEKYGTSSLSDYCFLLNPSFRGLNMKIDLTATYLPEDKALTITLDP